jgi:hypothetical protein
MCSYDATMLEVHGSGKGTATWLRMTEAMVSLDHPQHATADHTLNIDFLNRARGPSARVAVELTEDSARLLAETILRVLGSAKG